jgi:hypothetical protein
MLLFKVKENVHPHDEFRKLCSSRISYARHLVLPPIVQGNVNEAVLIEFRPLPHLEFLIRNTIHKLGRTWSHTVVCGTQNYDFMVRICRSISPHIKIIPLQVDNMVRDEYSNWLTTARFWNLFQGEKILIYQEDSMIFKRNMHEFLHFDYIGAPWPLRDGRRRVGNGGFSLRSKSVMLQVIEKNPLENYIKLKSVNWAPEDVYFSETMEDFKLGILADRKSAFRFSTEHFVNTNSLGGHQFWKNDPHWKLRII